MFPRTRAEVVRPFHHFLSTSLNSSNGAAGPYSPLFSVALLLIVGVLVKLAH
jgi:hypothetical protein